MKQAVDQHDVSTGTVRFNGTFRDFVMHHGALPSACPPYWPRAKGKVERGIGYVKRSFLEGRTFTDLDDLNGQLTVWLDTVANVRIHGTTIERPVDRHARELEELRPLSSCPAYDPRPSELRVVHSDSHIRYAAVDYSVDPRAVGHTVTVRPDGEAVGTPFSVYLGDELVAQHRIHARDSRRVTLSAHDRAIQRLTRGGPIKAQARRSAPRFIQIVSPLETSLLASLKQHAPDVQIAELAAYERAFLETELAL